MKVRRVFQPDVVSIEAWESLQKAASQMHNGGFGCLPVLSHGELIGIITERDVMEAVAANAEPNLATVFDYMTEDPRTVSPEDECSVAVTDMLAVGCRHLPVVEGIRLVGIVSARDLLPLATAGTVD